MIDYKKIILDHCEEKNRLASKARRCKQEITEAINRKKYLEHRLAPGERPTKQIKRLAKIIRTRQAELNDVKEAMDEIQLAIRHAKASIEKDRPLSECFMDVCREELDERTFTHLLTTAKSRRER